MWKANNLVAPSVTRSDLPPGEFTTFKKEGALIERIEPARGFALC